MDVDAAWEDDSKGAGVWPGSPEPRGATWSPEATNFAVYAPDATGVEVCLYDAAGRESRHALTEHTLGVWHGAVPDVAVDTRYGFRVDGPWDPMLGQVFNRSKLLLDPYARAVSGSLQEHPALYGDNDEDSAPYTVRGVVVHDDFDWGADAPPKVSWTDTVVYETHVRGFTKLHDQVPEHLRGTYAGLANPHVTTYLKGLGVTTVELLPVHQFTTEPVLAAAGRVNYWGYNTLGFFAPHAGYSSSGDRGGQVREFKQMVRSLHAAGLEVVLDVVYNHTAEGSPAGPTLSLRGFDDLGYYKRVDVDQGDLAYFDVTGCGNTLDAGFPAALRLILDSLRYWVTEMHVDGFRVDLATALTRTRHDVDMGSDFLTAVSQDPVLRTVKLIAEPWDVSADGYLVGSFPPPWCEWNDRYRNTVRDFWRGRSGGVRDFAYRLSGSSDLYADDGRSPYASINFLTAHDGFTLRDLVSYDHKHNEANGHDNTDGNNDNRSWNCGVEGETDDPHVLALRRRQAANLLLTLCLSTGVPMVTAGDERGRTQRGNNNAYVQDNEISWVDWRPDDAWLDLYDAVRTALRLRRDHPALRQRHFFEGRPAVEGGPKDLAWIHPEGREMTVEDWHDAGLQTLGMFVSGDPLRYPGPRGERLHDSSFVVWFHSGAEPAKVLLAENKWFPTAEVVLSTDPAHAPGSAFGAGDTITLDGRSLVVLRTT
jgi:glycogen debranching enzyme GlgX